MSEIRPFPWADIMNFGLGHLKLSPSDFWSMTLPEFHAAMSPGKPLTHDTVDRTWLEAALRQHPDPIGQSGVAE